MSDEKKKFRFWGKTLSLMPFYLWGLMNYLFFNFEKLPCESRNVYRLGVSNEFSRIKKWKNAIWDALCVAEDVLSQKSVINGIHCARNLKMWSQQKFSNQHFLCCNFFPPYQFHFSFNLLLILFVLAAK